MTTFSGAGAETPGTATDAYIAALRMLPRDSGDPGDADDSAWLRTCYRLTPRVERISPSRALLDLGRCTPTEALDAIHLLLTWLGARAASVRVGLAPSLTLAQLAMLQTSASHPLWLVTPAEVPAFLRPLPVEVLAELSPPGSVTAETLRQLEQYGLRTLGQLAHLGTPALRRHFGAAAGDTLAAVATGRDPRPLSPTPSPATLSLRLRLPDGALPPAEISPLLPLVAAQAATLLHQGCVQTQRLRLAVRWESGDIQEASLTLPQPTQDLSPLARALQDLLQDLLQGLLGGQPDAQPDAHRAASATRSSPRAIADLRLTLGELRLLALARGSFWQTPAQRLAATAEVAETLAVRYGRALVLRPRLAGPAAIFHEERYRLAADAVDTAEAHDAATGDSAEDGSKTRPSIKETSWRDVPHRLHWW